MTTITFEQAQARLNYDEWFEYADRVASSFARSYPGVEKEDIKQELHVLLVEKKEQFLSVDNPGKYITVSMKHAATAFCQKERSSQMFWSPDYLYRPDDIRKLVAEYYEQPQDMWIPQDAVSVHGNDDAAIAADISQAMHRLPENYLRVLEKNYMTDESLDQRERQTLSRAIKRLTDLLNNKRKKDAANHTGPGSRKVITNAAAVYQTKAVMA